MKIYPGKINQNFTSKVNGHIIFTEKAFSQ